MSSVRKEILSAHDAYAMGFGDRAKLAMPPGRRFAILTCMDARLELTKYAGSAEGGAHAIRVAGGRLPVRGRSGRRYLKISLDTLVADAESTR
jgi:carbonic anhydrase